MRNRCMWLKPKAFPTPTREDHHGNKFNQIKIGEREAYTVHEWNGGAAWINECVRYHHATIHQAITLFHVTLLLKAPSKLVHSSSNNPLSCHAPFKSTK